MGTILKTVVGLLLVVVIGSFIIDSSPVSKVLMTAGRGTDPLVASARAVKQEVRVLTGEAQQVLYTNVVKTGLKKAADTLNKFADSQEPPVSTTSKESSL